MYALACAVSEGRSVRAAAYVLSMVGDPLRRGVAEFVGAFTLTFIAAGAAIAANAAQLVGDQPA